MSLTNEQINALLAPIDAGRVREVRGNAHVEAWDDRRWLLRIFGWGGFAIETLECELVSQRSVWDDEKSMKGRHSVVYRVQARLIIKDADGREVTHFDDGATGDSVNQPSLGDAHDQALKTAMSQALKRCCVNLGDQFGLSLYNGGRTVPVVGRSLAHASTVEHDAEEKVSAGEMDSATVTAQDSPPAPPVEPSPASGDAPASDSLPEAGATPAEVEAQTAAQVEKIRDRVHEAMKIRSNQDALMKLTRVSLDAGKAGLMAQMTTMPTGEPVTVAVLLDNATKIKSRTT
jgi:hypothetical protein